MFRENTVPIKRKNVVPMLYPQKKSLPKMRRLLRSGTKKTLKLELVPNNVGDDRQGLYNNSFNEECISCKI
jgi:hypothetical protein